MKFIWEVEDIKPGRRFTKKGATETWIICYRVGVDDYEARYVCVSENDGMVTLPYSKEALVGILNETGAVPVDDVRTKPPQK